MPNNEENAAILKDRHGNKVALKGVKVHARLHDLMAEIEVEQSYANHKNTNIEAVYTFPLPLGAVLLGLEVEIGGKKLSGSVVERKEAERNYEDAVTDGNSAVMLEEAEPGLYTASVGNLMAKESAVIRFRYGLILSWQGSRLRIILPATIAPRYGFAIAAGLQPHQVPEVSLDAEYPLDLSVSIEGDLASASIASPTHAISQARSDAGVVVKLPGKAVLDRDFVLTLESDTAQSACVLAQDKNSQVAFASMRIPPVQSAKNNPLALKIVIDCSGSMAGISIAQARKAALEILNLLTPQDRFNVTLFGNEYEHIFASMVPARARYITEAWNRLAKLDAEMGGTEMENALDAAFSLGGSDGESNLLLITDGEIYEHAKLVERAKQSGHRIFVVGVGSAVAEAFLKTLARTTGGACELVAPQEGMTERVLGQFHRMRQPKLGNLSIEWPTKPSWVTPLPETVFAGDTVHAFAGFDNSVTGEVILKAQGGPDIFTSIAVSSEAEIPRIAAARRMESATDEEGLRLALDYQLLSRWTNYLVIAERADKAEYLPEIHKVPQMLSTGCMDSSGLPAVFQRGRGALRSASTIDCCYSLESIDTYDIPAFCRKDPGDSLPDRTIVDACKAPSRDAIPMNAPTRFIASMETTLALFLRQPKLPKSIKGLVTLGLDEDVAHDLRDMVAQGYAEEAVVVAFINALSQSSIGDRFGRSFKRAILKAWKQTKPSQLLDLAMCNRVLNISPESWNWNSQLLDFRVPANAA